MTVEHEKQELDYKRSFGLGQNHRILLSQKEAIRDFKTSYQNFKLTQKWKITIPHVPLPSFNNYQLITYFVLTL